MGGKQWCGYLPGPTDDLLRAGGWQSQLLLNQGRGGSAACCDPDMQVGKKRMPAKSGEHGVANGARERVRSRWTQQ